jgi:oligoribonuclease
MKDLLLWCDLETEGLYPHPPKNHRIFEIGIAVTGLDLEIRNSMAWQIYYPDLRREHLDPFILDMHTKNGLLEDMQQKGVDYRDVQGELMMLIQDWEVPMDRTVPMCGNSIRMDREFCNVWLPDFDNGLSYRIIDVSSFKETFRRYRPEEYEDFRSRYTEDDKKHRVLDDIQWSIDEYRFYLQKMGMIK